MRSTDAVKNALRTATTIRPLHYAAGGDVALAVDYGKPDDLGMYSHGAVAASRMPMAKGSPEQIKGYLTKQRVKPDEFKWSGYDEKLGSRQSVTREEVARHFHENKPAIKEHVLRSRMQYDDEDEQPKFEQYTLPGGTKYHEHLLTLPPKPVTELPTGYEVKNSGEVSAHNRIPGMAYTVMGPGGGSYGYGRTRAEAIRNAGMNSDDMTKDQYRSSHWEQPNVLAHLRLSDRVDPATKKKILHLEELQSDWAQEGRTKGFQHKYDPATVVPLAHNAPEASQPDHFWYFRVPGNVLQIPKSRYPTADAAKNYIVNEKKETMGVPQAPYVDSTSKWVDLGLKRALYEAAKGGHDKLVVTPGEEQAKRYDLSKHFKHIMAQPIGDKHAIMAEDHAGEQHHLGEMSDAELPDALGKEMAQKIIEAPHPGEGRAKVFQNADLKVGGEGMKAFYDKMLPQALQKLAKRHDPAAEVKLHGHTLPKGSSKNPWSVLGVDGNEVAGFANEASARNYRDHMGADLKIEHRGAPTTLHSLDITPTMRASILKGSPHFESGGAVPRAVRASGGAVNHQPIEAQKTAGNYAKEHVSFQGLPITIENKKGSVRSGKDADGKLWACRLPADYGYIKGTLGADGDHVDVFIGPHKDSKQVFIINQHDHKTRRFDEHKVVLGTTSEREARDLYCAAFSDGKGHERLGSLEPVSLDTFKQWLRRGKTAKPAKTSTLVDHALRLSAEMRS